MYRATTPPNTGRRSTRSARSSASNKRRRSGDGWSSSRGAGRNKRGFDQGAADRPARKWVEVVRAPGPRISFKVRQWIPYTDMTEDERVKYEARQEEIRQKRLEQKQLFQNTHGETGKTVESQPTGAEQQQLQKALVNQSAMDVDPAGALAQGSQITAAEPTASSISNDTKPAQTIPLISTTATPSISTTGGATPAASVPQSSQAATTLPSKPAEASADAETTTAPIPPTPPTSVDQEISVNLSSNVPPPPPSNLGANEPQRPSGEGASMPSSNVTEAVSAPTSTTTTTTTGFNPAVEP